MAETPKEKQERKKRAEKQIAEFGRASLKNLYSPEKIQAAMYASAGNARTLASILKVTLSQVFVYLNNNKGAHELWESIREAQLGRAEGVILDLMDSKSEDMRFRAAKYVLDHRHPEYQQGNSQEITVKNGEVSIKSVFGINDEE